MFQVPILRAGRPYYSKESLRLSDYATGEPIAEVSQANPGLLSRDLSRDTDCDLRSWPCDEILLRLQRAGRHFMESALPVGEENQTPEDFVAAQSATTGLPHALCRQNMKKIEAALVNMRGILDALTGGLDLTTLDIGYGQRNGHPVSFAPRGRRFGAVLPANSPGVHALWPPVIALKTSLAVKPGQLEPWTPLRILESLREAGLPESALGYYPCGHDGAAVILRRCGCSMLFGAGPTVRPWAADRRIEIHGPGYSKVVIGPDRSADWADAVELIAASVAGNGGRSCVNASSVRTASHGRALAEGLADRLARIHPLPRDDDQAILAAFPNPQVARSVNAAIERGLAQGGAEDLTGRRRSGERLVELEGGIYLLPTVVYCESPDHPLANQEHLFPFVSVVETRPEELVDSLGPSLVVTVWTEDPALEAAFMARADIGRLNLGPIPTTTIQWDQPHEGNIFQHLYQQRAFQRQGMAG